jgi:hypothetical protein
VPAFKEVFRVPAGHSLRLVRSALRGEVWEWEHEEHDARGAIVAVFESWSRHSAASAAEGRDGGPGGFVKYSPNGWVLRRSDADVRRRAQLGEGEVCSPMNQPRSFRETIERRPA